MVDLIQQNKDQALIEAGIKAAEEKTGAVIRLVVLGHSYRYQEFVLFYGLILGSAIGLGLWACGIHPRFAPSPVALLLAQFITIALVDFVPWLRAFCMRIIPKRTRYYHAGQMARHEYHAQHAGLPEEQPFILLFVSLAERYVHVVANPAAHRKSSDNWRAVSDRFIAAMRTERLAVACAHAIDEIAVSFIR